MFYGYCATGAILFCSLDSALSQITAHSLFWMYFDLGRVYGVVGGVPLLRTRVLWRGRLLATRYNAWSFGRHHALCYQAHTQQVNSRAPLHVGDLEQLQWNEIWNGVHAVPTGYHNTLNIAFFFFFFRAAFEDICVKDAGAVWQTWNDV